MRLKRNSREVETEEKLKRLRLRANTTEAETEETLKGD